jgi:hypothetical protein
MAHNYDGEELNFLAQITNWLDGFEAPQGWELEVNLVAGGQRVGEWTFIPEIGAHHFLVK